LLRVDGTDASVVTAVINLGPSLGMIIVAEGVKSPEQVRQLQHLGCHDAQGFYFAPAVPAAEFATLLVDSPRLGESFGRSLIAERT
jgi:c-di-GMP phosphodiesterase